MDSEKEKNRLSDIVLERVGLTGNLSRHLLVDAQNDRRADETGASLGCGGRDQGVIGQDVCRFSEL